MAARVAVTVRDQSGRLVARRSPWVFSNEVDVTPTLRQLPPGSLVRLVDQRAQPLATAFFNPHSNIIARVLWRETELFESTKDWLRARIAAAAALRLRVLGEDGARWCRLVHAEGDGLPGVVVDRFDGTLAVQINSAGLDRLGDELVQALQDVVRPTGIVIHRDTPARVMEGLASLPVQIHGRVDTTAGAVSVEEDGVRFPVDILAGQKTGWFYDQRSHRRRIARLSPGARVLDLYSYSGGFGIRAAVAGAKSVTVVDSSMQAMSLAQSAATMNSVQDRVTLVKADASKAVQDLCADHTQFDIVVADPPPFAPSASAMHQGLHKYTKLAKSIMPLLPKNGLLFIASCSHNITEDDFERHVSQGIAKAGRDACILHRGGAGADHPVHFALPQTAYLKTLLYQVH